MEGFPPEKIGKKVRAAWLKMTKIYDKQHISNKEITHLGECWDTIEPYMDYCERMMHPSEQVMLDRVMYILDIDHDCRTPLGDGCAVCVDGDDYWRIID